MAINVQEFINNSTATQENIVAINGTEFKVSDDIAIAILKIAMTGKVPTATVAGYKAMKANWKVEKVGQYYRISSDTYSKCAGHSVANMLIKSLPDIKTFKMSGKNGEFTAWGFTAKAKADAAVKSLPDTITAEQQQKYMEQVEQRRASR